MDRISQLAPRECISDPRSLGATRLAGGSRVHLLCLGAGKAEQLEGGGHVGPEAKVEIKMPRVYLVKPPPMFWNRQEK